MNAQNMLQLFKETCHANGVNSFVNFAPDGSAIVYIDVAELDPLTACMKASLDIALKRESMGLELSNKRIKIVKNKLVTDPSCAYAWSVKKENGETIAGGFARNEQDAQEQMRKFLE